VAAALSVASSLGDALDGAVARLSGAASMAVESALRLAKSHTKKNTSS
jgi:hypothetical protein